MAKGSDNDFPSILFSEQGSAPTTPAAGKRRIYWKTDNKFYVRDESGTETEIGGASGAATFTSAFASPATAAAAGDIWLPNDAAYIERATAAGSASWVPWGPIWPMADPNLQTFSWANQGSATVASTNGGVYLEAPANLGAGIRARVKSKTAPYVITAALQFNMTYLYTGADCVMGLLFSDATKFQLFGIYLNSGVPAMQVWVAKYTDASTYDTSYVGPLTISTALPMAVLRGLPLWWRIADDNSNRICSFSTDGFKWFAVHSVGRTDFLTATQVGFFVNNLSTTYDAGVRVLSWVET